MSASSHTKAYLGEWPDLPAIPPSIPKLPEPLDNPTREEERAFLIATVRALGTTILSFGQLWPRTTQALEYLKANSEFLRAHVERLNEHHRYPSLYLPEMRAPSESISDAAEEVARDVRTLYERDRDDKSTPPPGPDKIEEIVRERVTIEVERIKETEKARAWDKLEEERKAAELDRLESLKVNSQERTRAKWKMIGAIGVGFVSSVGWAVEHFWR
jgi:hypothetical protein